MVVEDDFFTQQLIVSCLDTLCDCITADTTRKALVLYENKVPDLVLMDIELPDGDGADAVKKICAADRNAFILMLSAHSFQDKVLNSLSCGAKGFIAKPFTKDRLVSQYQRFANWREEKKRYGTESVTQPA